MGSGNDKGADEIAEIAGQIERYLATHPDAVDSLEGILHWWLLRQRYTESAAKVQQALERLVASGAITRRVLPEGRVLFAAPTAKTEPKDPEKK